MRPKKSLGQNFLHSTAVRGRIIAAADLSPEDGPPYTVLEIGPGKGFLTEALLLHPTEDRPPYKVVAVEKDDQLYEFLREKFAEEIKDGRLELIHGDVLELTEVRPPYKVVANIPYNITGEIIRLFLEKPPGGQQPESMVLLVQKEVAERIMAKDGPGRPGKESLLSMSVKAFGEPEYVHTVRAGSFFPVPKVDSAILAIRKISKSRLNGVAPEKLFALLHAGFAHKRKTLRNNLPSLAGAMAACTINPQLRAEKLTLDQWICLAKHLDQSLSANGS